MRLFLAVLLAFFLVGCTSAVPPPISLSVATTNLPAARLGTPYAQQLTAAGGSAPYSWIIVSGSLPAGITLSSGGLLEGIPTTQGSFSFTVQVTDSTTTTAVIQIRGQIDETS